MDFELTEEQKLIKSTARRFAEEKIAPVAERLWEEELFSPELFREMGEIGLLGIPYPEEYGGGGMDVLSFTLVLEELARVDNSVANAVMANSSCASLLSFFGSHEQKERYLTPILTGVNIGSIGLTEADAGSDAGAIKTSAVQVENGWVINGTKMFISNSGTGITLPIVVMAVTGEKGSGGKEISAFIVPRDTMGLSIGKQIRKIGWRGSDTHELSFEDCHIGSDHLLGHKGAGLKQALAVISVGRILIASMALGLAQGCLDACTRYVRERKAFGKTLGQYQAIQFKLADMVTQLEAARLLVRKAAFLKDQGRPFADVSSMAKLFATEMAMQTAHQAVQIHGGYGVTVEYPVARAFGDAKVLEIVEGTSEIQRMLIARSIEI